MARVSNGAMKRNEGWRRRVSPLMSMGWPITKAWPISNDDLKAIGLPHQGAREKARRLARMEASK